MGAHSRSGPSMGSSKPVSPEARVIALAGRLTDCWRGGTDTSAILAEMAQAVHALGNKSPENETNPSHQSRALLMVAYDWLDEYTPDDVKAGILKAVCPAGTITESDLEWARSELKANDRLEYRRSLGLPNDGSESEEGQS